MEEEGNALFST
jgi:hypothetical protein